MEPNEQPVEKNNGALIGSVIIIVILVIGAIYFWQTSLKDKSTENQEPRQGQSAPQGNSGTPPPANTGAN